MINIKNIIISSSFHVTNFINKKKFNKMNFSNLFNIHIFNENVIMTDKNTKQTTKWKTEIVRLKKQWIIVLLKFRFEQLKKKPKQNSLFQSFHLDQLETILVLKTQKFRHSAKKKNVLKFLSFSNIKIKRKLNTGNLSNLASKFLTWKKQFTATNFNKFNVQLLIWIVILTLPDFDLKKSASQSFDKNFQNDC